MRQSDGQRHPTLLNSCAMAATSGEARFRIEYPFLPRDSRIVAVDAKAAEAVCRARARHWSGSAHFLTFVAPTPRDPNGTAPDAALRTCDGAEALLSKELADADVVVMVAGAGDAKAGNAGAGNAKAGNAKAAAVIGRACAERGIMTAGVALVEADGRAGGAVVALRPHAMVLVVSKDEEDLIELLTALRA